VGEGHDGGTVTTVAAAAALAKVCTLGIVIE